MKALLILLLLVSLSPLALADSGKNTMIEEIESQIIRQTNELRKKENLLSVELNEELKQAAESFAKFMAETGKYGHHADGKTPSERAKEAGYKYCVVRENIAYRTNTGEVTADGLINVFMKGWIESPAHRENMLAEYITQTGVAVATTDDVTYFAVQLFGRPRSAAIKLKISNHSNDLQTLMIESGDGSDEFEIPVKSVITMTRCLPTSLRLNHQDDPLVLRESADLVITQAGITKN